MTNLVTRALSGAVYVALIVGSLFFSTSLFCFLMICFGVLAATEYSRMVRSETGAGRTETAIDLLGVLFLTAVPFVASFQLRDSYPMLNLDFIWYLAAIALLYYLLRCGAALSAVKGHPLRSLAYSLFGVTYISVGIVSAQLIDLADWWILLAIFVFIWLNDTGAYLVGSAIGRHKMTPRLSPKKSWEGFFGGMLCCIAVGAPLCYVGAYELPHTSWIVGGTLFPACVSVLATLGDLLESLMKRSVGVKDAGHIIPGHGGVLDRIDSLLFVMPGILLLALILQSL